MRTKLPLELREKISLSLFDRDVPRTVSRTESETDTQTSTSRVHASDIFHDEYIFDEKVMGFSTSQEIQETCLRTAPIYFRGCSPLSDVERLVCVHFPYGNVGDIIRHLRIYLRFEHFQRDKTKAATQPAILPPYSLFTEAQLELEMYKKNSTCLDALAKLPFLAHKIKLEICIFYSGGSQRNSQENIRTRYNLFETVKPAFYRLKNAGADVSVHWEDIVDHENAGRMDATELYEANAEAWIQV